MKTILNKNWYTAEELSQRTSIDIQTIQNLNNTKQLCGVLIGRIKHFKEEDLAILLEAKLSLEKQRNSSNVLKFNIKPISVSV